MYTENNLSGVLDATSEIEITSWKVMGLMFGMSDDVLENIQNSDPLPKKCYQSILEYWIKTGRAYWSVLVDTLRSPLLGEDEVAEEISTTYLSKIMLYLYMYLSPCLCFIRNY